MLATVLRIIVCVLAFSASAQKSDSVIADLRQAEWELAQLQRQLFHSKNESERVAANKEFLKVWDRVAVHPEIVDFPFSSLKDISILNPADKKFRLVTWNLFKNDGSHVYFGYLFVKGDRKAREDEEDFHGYEHYKLLDRSMQIKNVESHTGTPDNWFGMLYTQVIDCDDFYTLIGWDGNDRITTRKFIDVLSFKKDGSPLFGKDVFSVPRRSPRRQMFEFSSEVSMSLKYVEKTRRIVYSHLAPRQEGDVMEGQFQYYGPDGSFDAMELRKGRWVVVEDVDARNEKSANDNVQKPDPKKQKPIYVPK